MDLAHRILADADDEVDRQQGREATDRGRERTENAQLRAIIAVDSVERISDEASVTGLSAEQS